MSEDTSNSQQPFLFDDFFVDDADAGVVHSVTIRGRQVPITTKRGVTLADKEAATQAAIKRHITPKGQIVVDGIDDAVLTVEILVRSIKAWPFTFNNGTPVPITRENIRRLLTDAADALALAIAGTMQAKQEEANGPFVPASVEA